MKTGDLKNIEYFKSLSPKSYKHTHTTIIVLEETVINIGGNLSRFYLKVRQD